MNHRRFGVSLRPDGRCEWRIWAPRATLVDLVLFDQNQRASASHAMRRQRHGFFACEVDGIDVGQRYAFRLNGNAWFPDPASQWQPDGVHQPSAVWRADNFAWNDQEWHGIDLRKLVIYELHVGTFTPAGTFAAVIPRLPELRELGVTAVEIMPVGQFPGMRGWGYDGAYWFAVQQSYGGPTELQRLVDACHGHGLAVILDVVYNHLGPEGNYLREFGPFFTDQHQTPWGAAINYDGPSCRVVRDFVLENVRYWIRDFHIDGLRLDAVHAIQDDSPAHLLTEIKQTADQEARLQNRPVHVIAESNLNDVKLIDPASRRGYGLDAQWSDDFHHCVHVLLTGEQSGYYADYPEPARQLVKALNDVFVYDGCYSQVRGCRYGTSAAAYPGERFVIAVQTHDQVGNRAQGDRLGTLVEPARQRFAAGLLLLAPYLPLIFMGEEYGESRPFPFFCDFGDESLREAVRRGRREEFASFGWTGDLPDPNSQATFESAILSWQWPQGSGQAGLRALYRELLALRRRHPALQDFQHRSARLVEGSGGASLVLLERGTGPHHVTGVFNLGPKPAPLKSLDVRRDRLLLHSEETRFGGAFENCVCDGILPPFAFAAFENPTKAIP
jgi:maltooligosyltrehalose trehalohydrolase